MCLDAGEYSIEVRRPFGVYAGITWLLEGGVLFAVGWWLLCAFQGSLPLPLTVKRLGITGREASRYRPGESPGQSHGNRSPIECQGKGEAGKNLSTRGHPVSTARLPTCTEPPEPTSGHPPEVGGLPAVWTPRECPPGAGKGWSWRPAALFPLSHP